MIVIEQVSLQDYEKLANLYDRLVYEHNNLKRDKTTVDKNYEAILKEKNRFLNNMRIRHSNEKKKLCQIEELKLVIDDKEKEICYLKHAVDCIIKNQATSENICNKKCRSTQCEPVEISLNTRCPNECGIQPINAIHKETDCERQPSLMEHNGCGEVHQLLSAIENSYSKESSDPTKILLEQSKITINNLSKNLNTQSDALKKIQNDLEYCSKKLNEERKNSESKDNEICKIKTDLTCLEDELKSLTKKEHILSSSHKFLTEELLSKTMANNELLQSTEKLKDEIVNMEYSLNSRINETKSLEKELIQKNKIIENNIKIEQELECKLKTVEKKLKESETSKNDSASKCIELSKEYSKIENELKKEKIENIEKASNNEALCNKILNLENVKKGLESKNILYTEDITKLEKEKSTIQQKLNDVINENNRVVEKLKNESELLRSKLACAEKNSKDQNEKLASQQIHMRLHQLEITNFEKQIEDYKIKIDLLNKKCAYNDLELAALKDDNRLSNNRICELTDINEKQRQENVQLACTMKLKQKEHEEMDKKITELNENCCRLEKGNIELALNIDEITEQLLCAKKKENCMRKELINCQEKLDIAAQDISNFELEKTCIENNLRKKCDKLASTEQKLQDTINKLNEETCQKNKTKEKYLKIKNTCSCAPLDNTKIPTTKPSCKYNVQCQTDISEKNILKKLSEHDTLLAKNNKLANENGKLQKCTKKLKNSVQKLTDENNILKGKELILKEIKNNRESISFDTGVQANLCPNVSQSKIALKSCESELEFDQNSINVSNSELYNSYTTSCVSCDLSLKTLAPDNYPLDNDPEIEKLKCQLKELKKLLKEQEKSAYIILTEMKSQYQKKLDKQDAQLINYETKLLCIKRLLKECQSRETRFKNDLIKIKECLKNKNQVIEYEQNKVVLVTNNGEKLNKQINDGKEVIELDKLNKCKLEGQTESFTTQNIIKKQQSAQNAVKEKKTKRCNDSKIRLKKKKCICPKLNLSCCESLKYPCNRQKYYNLPIPSSVCQHQLEKQCLEGQLTTDTMSETLEKRLQNNFSDDTKYESLNHENVKNCTKLRESNNIEQIRDKIPKEFIDSMRLTLQEKTGVKCFTPSRCC